VLIILTLGSFFFDNSDFVRSLGVYLFICAFLITIFIKDPDEDLETVAKEKEYPSYSRSSTPATLQKKRVPEAKTTKPKNRNSPTLMHLCTYGSLLVNGFFACHTCINSNQSKKYEELRYNLEKGIFDMEKEVHPWKIKEYQWKREEHQWKKEDRKKQEEQEKTKTGNDSLKMKEQPELLIRRQK
jgi:hypothetical protein